MSPLSRGRRARMVNSLAFPRLPTTFPWIPAPSDAVPLLVAAAGAVSVGATASAEEWDAEKYLVIGAGSVSLRPQLEVSETYDSNIFYQEEGEVSDLITVLRPGLVGLFGERTENFVSLRYTLDASFYADRDDLNNTGHQLVHQTRYKFSRLTLQADDRFSITRNLLGGSFSYIERRVGQMALSDVWRADYEVSPRTVVGLKATADWIDYDEDDLKPFHLYDYFSYSGGARFGYRPSDRITIFPEVTAGQSMLSKNDPSVRDAPDLTFYNLALGAEGQFTPRLSGEISGGYEFRSYEDDTEVPDGWIATMRVRWQARPKTAVSVGYRHWIQVSRETFGYVYNAHRPIVSVTQEFGTRGRWFVNLDGYYQFDDYDEPVLVNGQPIERNDNLAGVSLRASYRWRPWLVASAGYDFLHYDDNLPGIPNYDVHRFNVRLAAGY